MLLLPGCEVEKLVPCKGAPLARGIADMVSNVQDGDAVVIFNFRADRVVELSKALEYKDFDKFDRKRWPDVRVHIIPFCTPG